MSTEKPRHHKGAPDSKGGQYAAYKHGVADVDLGVAASGAPASALVERPEVKYVGEATRLDTLARAGYVPATIFAAADDPTSAARREAFWDQHALNAEHGGDGAGYPKMPDDYTPNMTGGNGLSGHRRTHRMKYEDDGLTVRMPSVTSIKRFAAEQKSTFDVPVSAVDENGRPVSAWVRVTKVDNASWSVQPLGFGGVTGAKVSEAIAARLESRRPSRPPTQDGSLIDRFQARRAAQGENLEQVRSQWIEGFSYLHSDGVMVMRTSKGSTYGYNTDKAIFDRLRTSTKPGVLFNALVKGKTETAPVAECDKCHHYYSTARSHRCPGEVKVPDGGLNAPKPANRRMQRHAASLAGIFRRRGPVE
jgi:hypothetical protein